MGLQRLAGAGGSAGRDDDDVIGIQEPRHEPGREGQGAGGRVAARDGDPGGALELVTDEPPRIGISGRPYGQVPAWSLP